MSGRKFSRQPEAALVLCALQCIASIHIQKSLVSVILAPHPPQYLQFPARASASDRVERLRVHGQHRVRPRRSLVQLRGAHRPVARAATQHVCRR
jgi:hypothetical protein